MDIEVNKEEFETFLFTKFISDGNFVGMVSDVFYDGIFSSQDFRVVSKFVFAFWKKFNRIPTSTEVNLYIKDENFKKLYNDVAERIKNVKIDELDEEIFLNEAEIYIKQKMAVKILSRAIDSVTSNRNKEVDAPGLVRSFEKVSGFSLRYERPFSIKDDLQEFIKASSKTANRLPTGFACIDNPTHGGILADGKFIGVICAETNMGKSLLLSNIACNVARSGKRVLIISLEMSEASYAARIYSDLYGIKKDTLHMNFDSLRSKLNQYKNYGGIFIKEYPPRSLTVDKLRGYLDELRKKGETYDLICVDYLMLMKPENSENSYQSGDELTLKLRALTYEFNCPILTAAQLNRNGFNTSPQLDTLSDSMAIGHDCDLVLALYEQKEDAEQHVKRIRCLKSRISNNNFTGKLYYNKEFLRLEDFEEQETEQDKEYEEINEDFDAPF